MIDTDKIDNMGQWTNAYKVRMFWDLVAEIKRLRERLEVIEDFINDELRAFVNSNAFDHIYDAMEKKLEMIE